MSGRPSPSRSPVVTPFQRPTLRPRPDRKSTRLNSSHSQISYAVFCLKKKTDPTRLAVQLDASAYGQAPIHEEPNRPAPIGQAGNPPVSHCRAYVLRVRQGESIAVAIE